MLKMLNYVARLLVVIPLFMMGPGSIGAEEIMKAKDDIRVILDANSVPFSASPFIENSTTLVPFRPIFERMGLDILWDESTRTIIGRKPGIEMELQIDNPVAKLNGRSITLSAAPQLKEGYTFIPVRFISESVEARVEWNDADRTVMIYSKKEYASTDAKFHFTAYGLWRNMAGLDQVQPQVAEKVGDFLNVEEIGNIRLAIRYFNFTMLFIASEPMTDETKDMTLKQYMDRAKKKGAISSNDIMDEKKIKLFGMDALQLSFVNHNDWDKRIETLIVFKSGSQFYSIRNSSYEVTYKRSLQDFQEILDSMKFKE